MEDMSPPYHAVYHKYDQFDHMNMGKGRSLSAIGRQRERHGMVELGKKKKEASRKRKERQKEAQTASKDVDDPPREEENTKKTKSQAQERMEGQE